MNLDLDLKKLDMASTSSSEAASTSSSSRQLQIKLLTWDESVSVPTTALSVPASLKSDGLNQLVKGLLKETKDEEEYEQEGIERRTFDFLLGEDFVRGSLAEAAKDKGLTDENVLEVRYVDSRPPPEPLQSSDHDDWVGGVSCRNGQVLTACYDGTVNIFEAETGIKKLTIPAHSAPAKAVTWIGNDKFASASHDQTVMLHEYDADSNAVKAVNVLKGHERSVDCLDASAGAASMLASGSFDTTLKIWSTNIVARQEGDDAETEKGDLMPLLHYKFASRTRDISYITA